VARKDDRPIDVGLASLHAKDEATLIEWWKQRFGLIAAIPQDIARAGALTPQLRELSRVADAEERRRLMRARLIAFAQLPAEQQRVLRETRKRAFEIDRALLELDERTVQELLPQMDANVRAAYPSQ
jgi:hypothetical protein